jgi:hypothetical protein
MSGAQLQQASAEALAILLRVLALTAAAVLLHLLLRRPALAVIRTDS